MSEQAFICAHRGASGDHPENTILAFEMAVSLGCEMVEFDVRATADGRLVLLHDPSVDRTADGSGKIWELNFDEVRALDACAGFQEHSGIQIPTFDEALDFFPRETELNIHVYPGPEDAHPTIAAVCRGIRSRDLYRNAFIAGSDEVMNLVIGEDPKVRRCLLGSQDRAGVYAQLASELGCTNSQPTNSITTREFCDEAHALGLIVHPFYADEEEEMTRLIECGVDGILTNYPARMVRLLEKLA
ncbi:MAG: glycerophosphodiester phosphodiesterase family protein [Planctomycetota bacterium]|jgi:glycerophosphoryl diester phosphodiesterase|nr:glycerophosphodiester phosphodiesterase family protein [Planctomycetota bacterium]MDP6502490.1 glycerophosphodiester phosphodiesterase family protein [Planctomycetota bacterium]